MFVQVGIIPVLQNMQRAIQVVVQVNGLNLIEAVVSWDQIRLKQDQIFYPRITSVRNQSSDSQTEISNF
jgi:hypothetical protein